MRTARYAKLLLALYFVGLVAKFFLELKSSPILLIITLPIIVFSGAYLWKWLGIIVQNVGVNVNQKKITVIKVFLFIILSYQSIGIGMIVPFLIRFPFDIARVNGNKIAIDIQAFFGSYFTDVLIVIGLICSIPLIYGMAKILKFSKPSLASGIAFIGWGLLMLLQ
jgi:hypothetical protein